MVRRMCTAVEHGRASARTLRVAVGRECDALIGDRTSSRCIGRLIRDERAQMAAAASTDDVRVKELENARAVYRSIPKHAGAPYIAGLEPEDPNCGALATLGSGLVTRRYYIANTTGSGIFVLIAAFATLALWATVYRCREMNHQVVPSLGSVHPPVTPAWSAVEFALDKIRIVDALRVFPVWDKYSAWAWLRHPVAADVLYHSLSTFAVGVCAISVAKAIPVFPVFFAVGACFLSWLAALADTFLYSSALWCLDANATTGAVTAPGCVLYHMTHSYATNVKWCGTPCATLLIVYVLWSRGALWLSFLAAAVLPSLLHLSRLFVWYRSLHIVSDAIAHHGHLLHEAEELLDRLHAAAMVAEAAIGLLLGFWLMYTGEFVVMEVENKEPELLRPKHAASGAALRAKAAAADRKQKED